MRKKRRLKPKVKIALCGFICILCISIVLTFLLKKEEIEEIVEPSIATLCIDPGHGGYDSGTIGADGSYEKDINLDIALLVGEQIEKEEPRIKVIYTRDSDEITWPEEESKDLEARVDFAKDQGADYYLSIHMNSNLDPNAFGYESYVRQDDTFSQTVAQNIADNLDAEDWQYNRGTLYVEEYPLYVVSAQKIPALLFEAGYMSNYSECQDLQKKKNQKLIAKCIAEAYIEQILKDQNVDTKTEEE